jgi:hypothetical protein
MTKLVDLITISQNVPYTAPNSTNIEEWTPDELVFNSIYIALNNAIQVKAGLYMAESFPPLKIIYKSILNKYIKYFTQLNNNKVQSVFSKT